jgi:hypothetical protein
MADGGACTALEREDREAFIADLMRFGIHCSPRPRGQDMGGGTASTVMYGRRRVSASGPMAARRCAGQRLRGTRVAPSYCLDRVTRTDWRSEAGLGVCAPGGGSARRDGVTRDVARVAWVGLFEFRLALFEPIFLQIFELKWSKR